MGIVSVLATIVIQFWAQAIARLLQTRHFWTQLLPEVLKVKWIVVLLNWFLKFKRILWEKRPIFHLPHVDFLKAV